MTALIAVLLAALLIVVLAGVGLLNEIKGHLAELVERTPRPVGRHHQEAVR